MTDLDGGGSVQGELVIGNTNRKKRNEATMMGMIRRTSCWPLLQPRASWNLRTKNVLLAETKKKQSERYHIQQLSLSHNQEFQATECFLKQQLCFGVLGINKVQRNDNCFC